MDESTLELKAVFPLLKKWYGPTQRSKYGDLPFFWQDLASWPHKRAVLKEFEIDQQSKTSNSRSIQPGHQQRANTWGDYDEDDPVERLSLNDRKLLLARIKLEDVLDKLNKVVLLAQEAERDPNRSPSPEPLYNHEGIRTNTREVRMRNKFTDQKKQLIEEMLRMKQQQSVATAGGVQAPVEGPISVGRQIQRKIYMPVKDFPGRNFIGLIIGPRGNTQKRLEQETGCKIAIRGKGSVKVGRQGKPEDEMDELHVIITGDNEDSVDLAAEKVEELLRPMDDQDNLHKQEQLKELAIYNGTYRDHDTCHHCGEKGHKQWECPKKRAESSVSFNQGGGRGRGWMGPVVCKHCGERSHPSSDCPLLRVHAPLTGGPTAAPLAAPAQATQQQPAGEDSDFMDFWKDVSGTGKSSENGASTAAVPPPAASTYQPPPPSAYAPPQAMYVPPPQYAQPPPPYAQPPPAPYGGAPPGYAAPFVPQPPQYVAPPPAPFPPPPPPMPQPPPSRH